MTEELTAVLNRCGSKVLVTGPQRSGTTIASKILAHELGYEWVLEEEFGSTFTKDHKEQWKQIIRDRENFVMQCPDMMSVAREAKALVVLMVRPIEEIVASEWRTNRLKRSWKEVAEKYDRFFLNPPKNYIKLHYSALEGHDMWIEKEKRAHFHQRQTVL